MTINNSFEEDFSYLTLYNIGVSNIDLETFKKVKEKFNGIQKEKVDINSFFEFIFPLFKEKGFEKFFAIKENSGKKINLEYVKSLTELYYFAYLINREYKDKNYSAEEATFLFLENRMLTEDIKSHLKCTYDRPITYVFDRIFKTICQESIYIIDYLNNLEFNKKKKGITFYEVLKKYGNSKNYDFFIPRMIKNKEIHEEVNRIVKDMKKDLFRKRKKKKFSLKTTKFVKPERQIKRNIVFEKINNEQDSFKYFDNYNLFNEIKRL